MIGHKIGAESKPLGRLALLAPCRLVIEGEAK
jgi:hypothetical protein